MTEVEIKVALPGRGYSIWVGPGLLARAGELIAMPEAAEVIALITDTAVGPLYAERLARGLAAGGAAGPARVERYTFEAGEESKSLAGAEAALRWLASIGAHRHDLVVALGGGVVGDLGGFVAGTYGRGTPVVQVPTTVLAQVDAAIGGKTAVNLPEGKNLAGVFHQPIAVLADVDTLATLPDAEFRSGLAEVVKHGLIADTGILADLEREDLSSRDPGALTRVVERDETEQGERAILNYGHTLAHALETLGGYRTWRHGEAVAIGMVFAAHLAARLGFADRVAEHVRAISAIGLPTRGAAGPLADLAAAWTRDKKYRRGMRFVVLEDLGRPRVVSDVPEADIRAAYEAVR